MRLSFRIVFVLVCFLLGALISLRAQAVGPTITLIEPSSVTAGGPGFSLTVTGSGFIASSIVRVNGNNRTTVFVSSGQLAATILPGGIAVNAIPAILAAPAGLRSVRDLPLAFFSPGPL